MFEFLLLACVALLRLVLFPGLLVSVFAYFLPTFTVPFITTNTVDTAVIVTYIGRSNFVLALIIPLCMGIKWKVAGAVSILLFLLHALAWEAKFFLDNNSGIFSGYIPDSISTDGPGTSRLLMLEIVYLCILYFCELSARTRYSQFIRRNNQVVQMKWVLQESSNVVKARQMVATVFTKSMKHPLSLLGTLCREQLKQASSPDLQHSLQCCEQIKRGLIDVLDVLAETGSSNFCLPDTLESYVTNMALRRESCPFVLSNLLQQVGKQVSASGVSKRLQLYLSVDDDFSHAILGDPVRLQQTVLNLSLIALKLTAAEQLATADQNAATILRTAACLTRKEDSRNYVRIEIIDTHTVLSSAQIEMLHRDLDPLDYDDISWTMYLCRRWVSLLPQGEVHQFCGYSFCSCSANICACLSSFGKTRNDIFVIVYFQDRS